MNVLVETWGLIHSKKCPWCCWNVTVNWIHTYKASNVQSIFLIMGPSMPRRKLKPLFNSWWWPVNSPQHMSEISHCHFTGQLVTFSENRLLQFKTLQQSVNLVGFWSFERYISRLAFWLVESGAIKNITDQSVLWCNFFKENCKPMISQRIFPLNNFSSSVR